MTKTTVEFQRILMRVGALESAWAALAATAAPKPLGEILCLHVHMSNYGKWDSNFDLAKFSTNFRFSCIFGLGLWPFATILCMSEVKLGSPGLYKGLRAVGSHLPETASGFSIFGTREKSAFCHTGIAMWPSFWARIYGKLGCKMISRNRATIWELLSRTWEFCKKILRINATTSGLCFLESKRGV